MKLLLRITEKPGIEWWEKRSTYPFLVKIKRECSIGIENVFRFCETKQKRKKPIDSSFSPTCTNRFAGNDWHTILRRFSPSFNSDEKRIPKSSFINIRPSVLGKIFFELIMYSENLVPTFVGERRSNPFRCTCIRTSIVRQAHFLSKFSFWFINEFVDGIGKQHW